MKADRGRRFETILRKTRKILERCRRLQTVKLHARRAVDFRERAYPITADEILHGVAAFEAIVRSAALHQPVKV